MKSLSLWLNFLVCMSIFVRPVRSCDDVFPFPFGPPARSRRLYPNGNPRRFPHLPSLPPPYLRNQSPEPSTQLQEYFPFNLVPHDAQGLTIPIPPPIARSQKVHATAKSSRLHLTTTTLSRERNHDLWSPLPSPLPPCLPFLPVQTRVRARISQ